MIHVDAGFTGFPTGTRDAPYPAIQEAIDNSGGDIIRVSAGEYTGEIEPGDTLGFVTLKDNVIVIGEGADVTKLTGMYRTFYIFTFSDSPRSFFITMKFRAMAIRLWMKVRRSNLKFRMV